MAYQDKTPSDNGTPIPIESTTATDGNDNIQSSVALGIGSIAFDSNTGTVRLQPLLNFSFSSFLVGSAYWIETPINGAPSEGVLLKNNRFNVIERNIVGELSSTAQMVGFSQKITCGVTANADGSLKTGNPDVVYPTQKQNQVWGYGTPYDKQNGFLNEASMSAPHHRNNMFIPNGTTGENGWKEQNLKELIQRVSGGANTANIPGSIIRPNIEYFRCGTDPSTVDQINRYANKTINLSQEYGLTSDFTLPENTSFAISLVPYDTAGEFTGSNNSPQGLPYFRVYWGKYAFQYSTNPVKAFFIPDTTGNQDDWIFEPVTGVRLTKDQSNPVVTLIFEIVANGILISNALDTGDKDVKDKRPGWYWQDLSSIQRGQALTVPATRMLIGIRGMDIGFSYIPVVYPPIGKMSVANLPTGYNVNGLTVKRRVDSSVQMGGSTLVTINGINGTTGSFGFQVTLKRSASVDKTPALQGIELVAPPSTTTLSANLPDFNSRLKSVNIRLGVDGCSGEIVLDNKGGPFSGIGGIFPVQISGGWTSGPFGPLLNGFVNVTQGSKRIADPEIRLPIVGRDLILKDAIAVNLPLYDGMLDGEAIQDLLTRSGWGYGSSIDSGFQLPVPALAQNPRFKFPMGKPMMDCIRDIATCAGKWAFVDNEGNFVYVTPAASYGNSLGVYTEAPQLNSYTEWLSLESVKETQDTRNAVLVTGLKDFYNLPEPIMAIRRAEGGQLGNPLGNVIPWYRWIIYQDAKLNSQESVEGVAERLYQNNNRIRWTVTGQVWGRPTIVPFSRFTINLQTDDVGIPPGGTFRVIGVTHALNVGNRSEYFCNIEGEYIDPRYNYTTWW